MRISDWSSDVCSSDLRPHAGDRRQEDRAAPDPLGHPARRRAVPDRQRRGALAGGADQGDRRAGGGRRGGAFEIGRASCRERVCQYVYISWVAVSLKKNKKNSTSEHTSSKKKT